MLDGIKSAAGRIGNSRLAKNAFWMFVGQGMSVTCQAVYLIVLARMLGALQYGIFAGAFSMVMLIAQYCSLGSQTVYLRYVSPDHHKHARYWGNALVVTFTLGSVGTIVAICIGPHIATSYTYSLIGYVAIANCIFLQLTTNAASVFQAFEQMYITASINLLTNFLRLAAAVVMYLAMSKATAIQWSIIALIVSGLAAIISIIVVHRKHGRATYDVKSMLMQSNEGLIYAFTYSTGGILTDIDKVMLSHYAMNVANGIYSTAYQVVNVCTMPIMAVRSSAFPRFFQKGKTDGISSTAAYATRIVKHMAPPVVVMVALMYILAPILPRIMGAEFAESSVALRWLCLLPLFRCFHGAAGDALTGAGFQSTRLAMQLASAVFNFGVNIYLIPRFGWYGAAWSSLATDGMLAVLNWSGLFWIRARQQGKAAVI